MKLHFLQHVSFEGPAYIQAWSDQRGIDCSGTSFSDDGWQLPSEDDLDCLVVMGGPMNIYDYALYPWLADEKRFILSCIENGKRVLGVCLGAQLIADVMGAQVTGNSEVEIGWHPVTLTESGISSVLFAGLPETFMAFHWHGDTFSIPACAEHLARSEGCLNQAFSFEDRVLGLQFHLESSVESVEKLLLNCSDDMKSGNFVQDTDLIRCMLPKLAGLNEHAALMLSNLID